MEKSRRNIFIGVIIVIIIIAVGVGVWFGMKKPSVQNKSPEYVPSDSTPSDKVVNVQPVMDPQIILPVVPTVLPPVIPYFPQEPDGGLIPFPISPIITPEPVQTPVITPIIIPVITPEPVPVSTPILTPSPDIQSGFIPTLTRVSPSDVNNALSVRDEGYPNTGSFIKGTYTNIGTDSEVFCRSVGSPQFISCGIPGNPYKYMPPNATNGPVYTPGFNRVRGLFVINGTGDLRLDGKTVFCRGIPADIPGVVSTYINSNMACIGLNTDGSFNYENQYMGLGKLGNALNYFPQ